jgi:hypothetical protein
MKIKKIREIAKKKGINYCDMSETELIRTIQRAEGYSDCFARMNVNDCNQMNCLWREDCKVEVIAEADLKTAIGNRVKKRKTLSSSTKV